MTIPSRSTRERIEVLMDALDYRALGEIYCDEGGTDFWIAKRREVVNLGFLWAQSLARRLVTSGRSLYAGAGVAELPAMLTEVLDLNRGVVAANLRERECLSLNRSLEAAGLGAELQYRNVDAGKTGDEGPFDHLCAVSLLDDPETFPQVSRTTYGELHPVHLDLEGFAAERERVRSLVDRLWKPLRKPFTITTTSEEVPWFLERAEREGSAVVADDEVIQTAIVGDPLGFLVVSAG